MLFLLCLAVIYGLLWLWYIRVRRASFKCTVVHESGHVIVAWRSSLRPFLLQVCADVYGGGRTTIAGGQAEHTRDRAWDLLATCMAGMAAEQVVLGRYRHEGRQYPSSDLMTAIAVAQSIRAQGTPPPWLVPETAEVIAPPSFVLDEARDPEIRGMIILAYHHAHKTIAADQDAHRRLSDALHRQYCLAAADIARVVEAKA